MMSGMINTVIFDLDGVIIDSEPIHFDLERQMFDELNIHVSTNEHNSFVGMSSQNMWNLIVRNYDLPYPAQNLVKKKFDLYMEYLDSQDSLKPIPGVYTLIRALFDSQFKLAIASSSHLDTIEKVIRKFNLSEFFMARISGTDLKHSKPDPEIFLMAAKRLDSKPQECLVIEDSENGVKAAKAASMKCIGYQNPNSGSQNLNQADIVIHSFEELNVTRIRSFKLNEI